MAWGRAAFWILVLLAPTAGATYPQASPFTDVSSQELGAAPAVGETSTITQTIRGAGRAPDVPVLRAPSAIAVDEPDIVRDGDVLIVTWRLTPRATGLWLITLGSETERRSWWWPHDGHPVYLFAGEFRAAWGPRPEDALQPSGIVTRLIPGPPDDGWAHVVFEVSASPDSPARLGLLHASFPGWEDARRDEPRTGAAGATLELDGFAWFGQERTVPLEAGGTFLFEGRDGSMVHKHRAVWTSATLVAVGDRIATPEPPEKRAPGPPVKDEIPAPAWER